MKLCDILKPECVFLGVDLPDKDAVLKFAAERFSPGSLALGPDALFTCMMEREKVMSTGVGDGVGIPHGACPDLENACVLLLGLARPVNYSALDGKPVDIILAMVVPENQRELHLRLLACMARILKTRQFVELVRNATDPEALYQNLLNLEEQLDFI